MKNLLLKSILIVSHREKKAKKVKFHPQVNVVKGGNDTGKSSLIKSIYYTFGANPHSLHHKWKNADVAILIRFQVDNELYSIYRHRKSFSLFDKNNELIGTYSSVTNELSPVLAEIFNFKLKLIDREGYPTVPPPAYLLLPFYIDQDKGWVATWNSFTNLGQYPRWKSRVISYHMGIRPDKWYELDAERKKALVDQDEPQRQLDAINRIRQKTKEQLTRVDFDIDFGNFKNEIQLLLNECDALKIEEERYRHKIVELRTEQIRLDAQIEIVAKTHDELSEDYKFATQDVDDFVSCPTCGAGYNNSFSERFEIAKDTETCTDLLKSLRDDHKKTIKEIEKVETSLSITTERQDVINDLLSRKQGQVKLKDLVKLEGKKLLLSHLDEETSTHQTVIDELNDKIEKITEKIEGFDDPEHRKLIVKEYSETLRRYTFKLEVASLGENAYKRIDCKIDESGSDQPRAVLAYNFSVLNAIEKNGNATFFPIIIDAPNQQEQDPANLKKMLNFISDYRPNNHQLILGLVDDAGIDFEGQVIELKTKYSLLDGKEYDHLSEEIKFFEIKNLELDL